MKLKHKLFLFNIISKLLVIFLLWFILPYVVEKVIYNNTDKSLIEKKEKFINNIDNKEIKDFLLANDSSEVYGNFSTLHEEFIQLEVATNQKKIEKNVFFNDLRNIENQQAEYRILKHNFAYNKVNYELEIGSNINEINDLVRLIHYIIIITFLFYIIVSFILNNTYISYMLDPFYKILETKIKLINEPDKFIHTPIESRTVEFKDLDTALNEMMYRITTLFFKEKQFIGNVSHELLTPIAILKNRFENLIQNPSLNDAAVDKIYDSLNTLDAMKKVISNLLLISRIDNNQYKTNETIDLNVVISQLIENLEDRIQEKDIVVTNNLKHNTIFNGNKTLIQILITNLLTNAIKYNTKNGSITINDGFENSHYSLIISDTGIGMEADQVSQIFNRFTRLNFDQEGQGIGLAIVDSIAKLHQIEIRVTSKINQGSTFVLRFPF